VFIGNSTTEKVGLSSMDNTVHFCLELGRLRLQGWFLRPRMDIKPRNYDLGNRGTCENYLRESESLFGFELHPRSWSLDFAQVCLHHPLPILGPI
jgi:hypothetical protein